MTHPLDALDQATRSGLPRIRAYGWRAPMLATLTEKRFSDENWLFERKLDGVRVLSIHDGQTPSLWSRIEKRLDASYPELIEALAAFDGRGFIADGEIVAFDGEQTSFARLQARMQLTGPSASRAPGFRCSTTCSTCSPSTVPI